MVPTCIRGAVISTSVHKGFPRACILRRGTYQSHASVFNNKGSFRDWKDRLNQMKKLKFLIGCLWAMSFVACGPSKTDSPLELADYAVECFRTNEREKLLPYATERCKAQLTEDMAIEEQMKDDRGIKKMRELLQSTTYTRSQVDEMGDNNKLVRYTSAPSKYNMKVLLEQQDGKWLIDQVGPDR